VLLPSCSLQPSTKTRLRYYKRYVSPRVQQQGVQLVGAFRRTERDEDVPHFVGLARQYCGPEGQGGLDHAAAGQLASDAGTGAAVDAVQEGSSSSSSSSSSSKGTHPGTEQSWGWEGGEASGGPAAMQACTTAQGECTAEPESERRLMSYQRLVDAGVGIFTAGLSHTEFRVLAAQERD
jgi:hypothetical protein